MKDRPGAAMTVGLLTVAMTMAVAAPAQAISITGGGSIIVDFNPPAGNSCINLARIATTSAPTTFAAAATTAYTSGVRITRV